MIMFSLQCWPWFAENQILILPIYDTLIDDWTHRVTKAIWMSHNVHQNCLSVICLLKSVWWVVRQVTIAWTGQVQCVAQYCACHLQYSMSKAWPSPLTMFSNVACLLQLQCGSRLLRTIRRVTPELILYTFYTAEIHTVKLLLPSDIGYHISDQL